MPCAITASARAACAIIASRAEPHWWIHTAALEAKSSRTKRRIAAARLGRGSNPPAALANMPGPLVHTSTIRRAAKPLARRVDADVYRRVVSVTCFSLNATSPRWHRARPTGRNNDTQANARGTNTRSQDDHDRSPRDRPYPTSLRVPRTLTCDPAAPLPRTHCPSPWGAPRSATSSALESMRQTAAPPSSKTEIPDGADISLRVAPRRPGGAVMATVDRHRVARGLHRVSRRTPGGAQLGDELLRYKSHQRHELQLLHNGLRLRWQSLAALEPRVGDAARELGRRRSRGPTTRQVGAGGLAAAF
jgi:hypothetical protein